MEHFILDSYCHILVIRLHLLVGCRNYFPWETKAIPFFQRVLCFLGEEMKTYDGAANYSLHGLLGQSWFKFITQHDQINK